MELSGKILKTNMDALMEKILNAENVHIETGHVIDRDETQLHTVQRRRINNYRRMMKRK